MNKTYKYYLLTSFAIIIFALAAGFSRLFFYDKEYKILSQNLIGHFVFGTGLFIGYYISF